MGMWKIPVKYDVDDEYFYLDFVIMLNNTVKEQNVTKIKRNIQKNTFFFLKKKEGIFNTPLTYKDVLA